MTSIWVGNDLLVSYTYADDNGNLTRTTYGDGTYIDNVYDDLDRIIQIKIDGAVKYNYSYNGNGDLYRVEDVDNDTTYCYTYDSLGRLLSSWQQTDETVNALTYYTYDDQNRVSEYYCGLTGVTGGTLGQTYSYAYDTNDGNLISIQVSGENMNGDLLEYSYDGLKRLSEKQISGQYRTLAAEYDYETLSGGRSTTQVSGLSWTLQGAAALAYTYDYDTLGNINGVIRNGALEAGYIYDDQGQLITEYLYNEDAYYTYTYDTYGNIRSAVKRDLITDAVLSTETYSYTDTGWLDQLTSYNGESITYDEIGNPEIYNNGSFYLFAWENGRELSMVYHDGIVTSYAYGADGLRTQKTYGDTTYNYYYADGQLIRQTWGTHYIDFLYDETGSVYSIINDGTQYYFVKNLQGDVVQIRSIYGTVVVEYTYDAWGNVLSITGMYADTLGVNNPIRYRGYYQDFETGFYYLQSRYYDPAIRRFINADSVLHNSFLGYNQYAYCYNSPIAYVDTNGNSAQAAFEVWTMGAAPLSAVDGLLPIGDIIYWGGVLILGAIYIFSTVTADNPPLTYEKVDVKVEEKEKSKETLPPKFDQTYYHVTTMANAMSIISKGMMMGSEYEGGYVYAWKIRPSKYAIENSGAHNGVIISLKTNVAFVKDNGIVDPKVQAYGPVVSTRPGPILVWNVTIVGW